MERRLGDKSQDLESLPFSLVFLLAALQKEVFTYTTITFRGLCVYSCE